MGVLLAAAGRPDRRVKQMFLKVRFAATLGEHPEPHPTKSHSANFTFAATAVVWFRIALSHLTTNGMRELANSKRSIRETLHTSSGLR